MFPEETLKPALSFAAEDVQTRCYRAADLIIDLDRRRVQRIGDGGAPATEVALPRLSFELFATLVEAAPAALSGDDIRQLVWGTEVVTDDTLQQRVSLLRRSLEYSGSPAYCTTVRGFGYRLAVPVRRLSQPAICEKQERAAYDSRDTRQRSSSWRSRLLWTLAFVLLLLLITAAAMLLRNIKRSGTGHPGYDAGPTATAQLPPRPSRSRGARRATPSRGDV